MSAFVVVPIVAGEHDDGVLCDIEFVEQIKNATNVAVHSRDHCGLAFVLVGPVFIRVGAVVGNLLPIFGSTRAFIVRVRNGQSHVKEERIALRA